MSCECPQIPTSITSPSLSPAALDVVLDLEPSIDMGIDIVSSPEILEPSPSPSPALSGSQGPVPRPPSLEGVRVAPGVLVLKPRLPETLFDCLRYVTLSPEVVTPFVLLSQEAGRPSPVTTRAIFQRLSLLKSFKPVKIGDSLTYDTNCFISLSQDIIKADGDIRKFAFDTRVAHYDWLRTSATKFVRLLLHPDTRLPGFAPKNLSAFDGALEGVSAPEYPSGLLDINSLYCTFFLDNALPYYVYLYAKDIRGEGSSLDADELAFISKFDYYSFVAAITYLGSLLLTAAEGFSRILYEGVRWMLLRAYCILGILEWPIVKAHLSKDNPDYSRIAFSGMLSPTSRFNPKDTKGDSYAQYGWELFRLVPNALFYLASMTQIAFFNTYRYESVDTFFGLQSLCLSLGYVSYKPTRLTRKISEERYRKKDLNRFCVKALYSNCVYYRIPILENNVLDIAHELYVFFELLGIIDKKSILKSLHDSQRAKVEELQHYSPNLGMCFPSLGFPVPSDFGITRYSGINHFDLAEYLIVRYGVTFNPFILDTIPRDIYRRIFDERVNTLTPIAQLLEEHTKLKTVFDLSPDPGNEDNPAYDPKYDPKYDPENASRTEILSEAKRDLDALGVQIKHSLRALFSTTFVDKLKLEENFSSQTLSSNPLKPWEICLSPEDLLLMSEVIRTTYSNPTSSTISSRIKTPSKSKSKNLAIPETMMLLPRPPVKHPDAMFFALRVPPVGAETMIITSSKGTLYAGFSGILQGIIDQTLKDNNYLKSKTITYKVYPYTFVPLASICSDKILIHNLGSYIDMSAILDIYNNVQKAYPQSELFSLACLMHLTPYWMGQHFGSTDAKHYFEISSELRMNPIIMEQLASIYSIPVPVSTPRLTSLDYDRIRNSGRILNYVPRFTPADDAVIRALYSPAMTPKDKQSILSNCNNRSWKSIEMRARQISMKMLEEEKVFNISILPIRNYTAKTKELLERNFNAALNVDPRLKVDDNKKTEAALRKKYLTPRMRRPL